MALPVKKVHDRVVLQAVTTTAAGAIDTTGNSVRMARPANALLFILDVTAAATEVGDTFDVSIETRFDDGVGETWHQVVHFTQVVGNGGAKQYVEKIIADRALAGYETGTALSAGSVRDFMGDEWRVAWVQVDGTTQNASFTFSVTACPM